MRGPRNKRKKRLPSQVACSALPATTFCLTRHPRQPAPHKDAYKLRIVNHYHHPQPHPLRSLALPINQGDPFDSAVIMASTNHFAALGSSSPAGGDQVKLIGNPDPIEVEIEVRVLRSLNRAVLNLWFLLRISGSWL